MASPIPAIPRAENFLRTSIGQHTWSVGGPLPSLSVLAAMAGVSRTSMWKAVGLLKREGVLTARKGGCISLGIRNTTTRNLKPTHRRWQRAQAQIIDDIFNRRFLPGEILPTYSELTAKYGVSLPTLKRALASLASMKMVVPFGRSYRVPAISSSGFREEIILIMPGSDIDTVQIHDLRTQRLVDTIEAECARSRIRLRKLGINLADRNVISRIAGAIRSTENMAGCLIDLWAHSIPEVQRYVHDLFDMLGSLHKPVAVLDEMGTFELSPVWRRSPWFRIFRHAGRLAGSEVGRFIVAQGHRQAAFISYQHGMTWSHRRLQGLMDVFSGTGIPGNLSIMVLDKAVGPLDLFFALLDLDPTLLERIFSKELGKELAHDFAQSYKKTHALGLLPATGRVEQIRAGLNIIKEMAGASSGNEFLIPIFNQLRVTGSRLGLDVYLEPLFKQALNNKNITAWIAAEDHTALLALEYLKRKRGKASRNISVVGFDNSKEAIEQGLTSYDFNMAGIAQRMLLFVLHPPMRSIYADKEAVEVEGFLVERESTTTGIARDRF